MFLMDARCLVTTGTRDSLTILGEFFYSFGHPLLSRTSRRIDSGSLHQAQNFCWLFGCCGISILTPEARAEGNWSRLKYWPREPRLLADVLEGVEFEAGGILPMAPHWH